MLNGEDRLNIVLIEDDDVDALALERGLQRNPFEHTLLRVKDGVSGLELLSSGTIPTPFIILLDINMPRMRGTEFLSKLRLNPKLKDSVVFVFTSSRAEQDISISYRHNIAGYIVKSETGTCFEGLVHLLKNYWQWVYLPSVEQR